jgi:hypothetical protein
MLFWSPHVKGNWTVWIVITLHPTLGSLILGYDLGSPYFHMMLGNINT